MKTKLTWIEWLVIVSIVFVLAGAIFQGTVGNQQAYRAWVKQTGNPNKLTYQEWYSLMRFQVQDGQGNNFRVIPMPQ